MAFTSSPRIVPSLIESIRGDNLHVLTERINFKDDLERLNNP